jgi:hypothetical protein
MDGLAGGVCKRQIVAQRLQTREFVELGGRVPIYRDGDAALDRLTWQIDFIGLIQSAVAVRRIGTLPAHSKKWAIDPLTAFHSMKLSTLDLRFGNSSIISLVSTYSLCQ